MRKPFSILLLPLILICLLPTAAGRFILDLAGGLAIALLALPLLLTGIGWLGWKYLQSRLIKCEFCGASIISNSDQCPACGSNLSMQEQSKGTTSQVKKSIPASSAIIDVTAKDAD